MPKNTLLPLLLLLLTGCSGYQLRGSSDIAPPPPTTLTLQGLHYGSPLYRALQRQWQLLGITQTPVAPWQLDCTPPRWSNTLLYRQSGEQALYELALELSCTLTHQQQSQPQRFTQRLERDYSALADSPLAISAQERYVRQQLADEAATELMQHLSRHVD